MKIILELKKKNLITNLYGMKEQVINNRIKEKKNLFKIQQMKFDISIFAIYS